MCGNHSRISRRALLAGGAATLSSLSGCLGRLRRAADRDTPSQLGLEIKALPEDDDLYSLRVANNLQANLEIAGAEVDVLPTRPDAFLRDVLINLDFDMYVWRLPMHDDPDILRTLLHSRYTEESGWQNPFSYSNTLIDDLLDEQLRAHDNRNEILSELQESVFQEHPFIPVIFQEEHRVYRSDVFHSDEPRPLGDPNWILELYAADQNEAFIDSSQFGVTDGRMSNNLNPIAVEYRDGAGVTELLYDPPARRFDGELLPWLAESWEWVSPSEARIPTLEVTLRDNLEWHDGEPLTSDDVVFTYRFLRDTSMTDEDPVIPSPRYRGRSSLFDVIEAVDDSIIRIQFIETSRDLAERILTLPILPWHIWEEHTDFTEVIGIPVSDVTTDALVIDNVDAVGSGVYKLEDIDADNEVVLSLFNDHFIFDLEAEEEPAASAFPLIEEITFDIRPSVTNILNSITEGALDGSLSTVGKHNITDMDEHDNIATQSITTSRLYHIGFNLRNAPFTHHGLRDAIAQLVDREYIRTEIFQGSGRPTVSPVFDESLVPDSLVDDEDFGSFFIGESGSGTVEEEAARSLFRDVGFQYGEDGQLLTR